MRFSLISDVHLGPQASFQGKLRKLTHLSESLVEAFALRMRQEVRPDLVINLGDVLEDESKARDRERYARFVEILTSIGKPVMHVAGNHDTVYLTPADLCELWGNAPDVTYSQDHCGIHFAVLRSIETPDVRIDLPDEQLAWLERDLAATKLPTIVLMHHTASEMRLEGNRWFDGRPHVARIAQRREARSIIEASGKVIAVFNGHVHWNHLDIINGIPYVTLQSLIENLDDDAPGRPAAAYAVCDLNDRRLVITMHGAETLRYQVELTRPRDTVPDIDS